MEKRTIDINVEVRDLDSDVNATLDMLKSMRGVPKWQLIREALTEYADKHKADILANIVKRKR